MTANAGKDADGTSGQRPTGAGGKSGRTRKNTSAAKPPSDEVTVRTDVTDAAEEADGTPAADDAADKTVIDVTGGGEDTTTRPSSIRCPTAAAAAPRRSACRRTSARPTNPNPTTHRPTASLRGPPRRSP
jgi:hypothetical protein